jgi:transcription elongation factor Elf1
MSAQDPDDDGYTKAKIADVPCPECGAKAFSIKTRLVARPIGTYSLAGAQMKVSAYEWPHLVCGNCGAAYAAKETT